MEASHFQHNKSWLGPGKMLTCKQNIGLEKSTTFIQEKLVHYMSPFSPINFNLFFTMVDERKTIITYKYFIDYFILCLLIL